MPADPRLGPWLHSLRRWDHLSYHAPTMPGYRRTLAPMPTEPRRIPVWGWAIVSVWLVLIMVSGAWLVISVVGSVP